MEVAAFHPLGLMPGTRLCGPIRRVAAPGSYPASRSAEPGLSSAAPVRALQRLPGRLPLQFYRRRDSLCTRKETFMRRRLYFLLPDVESARRTADDLLLARVEDRHM